MKYCPNPECRYALEHGEGQEYVDEAVTCSDCGAELGTVRPVWSAAGTRWKTGLWLRLAITVLVPALVAGLASKVPLPRLDHGEMERRFGWYASDAGWAPSVFSLGPAPVASAFFLVELAALCVPRWRRLRIGGPAGRQRLWVATGRLAAALAVIQGLGIALYLQHMDVLERPVALSRLIIVFSMAGGTALLVLIARVLDRFALTGGFSLLVTAFLIASHWPWLRYLGQQVGDSLSSPGAAASGRGLLVVGALGLTVAGAVAFLRGRPAAPG